MNERIRELAEQAEIKFESHPQHQGVDTAVIIAADLQKFAELIVQECASVTLDYKNDAYYTGWCDHAEEILRHFGVQE